MVSNTKTKTRDTEFRLLQILYMLPLFVLLLFIVFIIFLIRQYQTDNQYDDGESRTYTIIVHLLSPKSLKNDVITTPVSTYLETSIK
jgi:hypothetical protein